MNGRRIGVLVAGTIIVGAPAGAAQLHKVKQVILDAGNPGKTLSTGYTTLEQTTIQCTIGFDCTLAMRIMANVGQATCKGEWAVVGLVDGNTVDGGPLVEALPSAGNTQTNIWQGMYTILGTTTHKVTFQLYLPCSANLNQWSVRYLTTR